MEIEKQHSPRPGTFLRWEKNGVSRISPICFLAAFSESFRTTHSETGKGTVQKKEKTPKVKNRQTLFLFLPLLSMIEIGNVCTQTLH